MRDPRSSPRAGSDQVMDGRSRTPPKIRRGSRHAQLLGRPKPYPQEFRLTPVEYEAIMTAPANQAA